MSLSPNSNPSASTEEQVRIRALLQRVLNDDQDAWTELVDSHTGLLLGLVGKVFERYRQSASRHDREDIVASVWSNLMSKQMSLIRSCLERGQILPLLHRLVRNRCIDAMRKRGPNQFFPLEESSALELAASEVSHHAHESDDARLEEALSSLSPKERTCVRLFYLQERSYRQISALTGIPMNSIGPLIRRSLDKLKAVIPKE